MSKFDYDKPQDSDMMMDESSGPETIETPAHKLESGQELWIRRGATTALMAVGYYFHIVEYDGNWARVHIDGHTDAEADLFDEDRKISIGEIKREVERYMKQQSRGSRNTGSDCDE